MRRLPIRHIPRLSMPRTLGRDSAEKRRQVTVREAAQTSYYTPDSGSVPKIESITSISRYHPFPGRFSYQNKWPHILMTASLAVSKQMLHSNVARSCSRSPSALPPLLLPPGPSRFSPAVDPPLLAGPMSLEDRGPAAAIVLTVQTRKTKVTPASHLPRPESS